MLYQKALINVLTKCCLHCKHLSHQFSKM